MTTDVNKTPKIDGAASVTTDTATTITKPITITPVAALPMDSSAVMSYIRKPGISIMEKLRTLSTNAVAPYNMHCKLIGDAFTNIYDNPNDDSELHFRNVTALYATIINVLNEPYPVFKNMFDIINVCFAVIINTDNELTMYKHTTKWSSSADLNTYSNLVTMLITLADITKRQNGIKKIDFERIFDIETNETMNASRLREYYIV